MDGTDRARHDEPIRAEPAALKYTSEYVRRLLLERHHIRAKLENPGGSIILTASALPDFERGGIEYSSEIGNSFHLDLMEVEEQLSLLPKGDVDVLFTYMDGMNSQQAAYYLNARGGVTIRKRWQRAMERLVGKLNGTKPAGIEGAGRTSDGDASVGRKAESHNSLSRGDSGRAPTMVDPEA